MSDSIETLAMRWDKFPDMPTEIVDPYAALVTDTAGAVHVYQVPRDWFERFTATVAMLDAMRIQLESMPEYDVRPATQLTLGGIPIETRGE